MPTYVVLLKRISTPLFQLFKKSTAQMGHLKMKSCNGVSVSVLRNGEEITPNEMGYLGNNINAGDLVEMQMKLIQQPVAGKRILVSSDRNRENVKLLAENNGVFSHTVPVLSAFQGTKFDQVDVNQNCVHLVELSPLGLVSVTNIVISAQDGEFFFVFHQTYTAQAYRGEQGVAIPSLWIEPGFHELVPHVVANYSSSNSLPPISSYKLEGDTKPEILSAVGSLQDENHLVVKFWSVRTGTGGALRKRFDGTVELVKLYWKNVGVPDRHPRHLIEGEVIHAKTFRSIRQGRIGMEAVGITRVEYNEAMA
jgi:hypothetical protein